MKSTLLMVGNFLSGSLGTRSVCEDLSSHLIEKGWPVITVSDKPGRIPRIVDMLQTVWKRRHEYSIAQIDVFSGPAFIWAEAVCQTLKLARKPFIVTLHGGNLPDFARHWPGRVRKLLAQAEIVTTPSDYLCKQMQIYRKDLLVFPNPIDINLYPFILRGDPRPNLVWLRAFHNVYHPQLAPRVVALLQSDFPTVTLNMIGPDNGDSSLKATIEEANRLEVLQKINFPGRIAKTEVPHFMNRGDIFLNTTNIDNTPVTILEALACGLCIVSTNVGGIPYLLEDECDALLVPPDNAEAMALAVRKILTMPDLAKHLSQNARKKAERFDWRKIIPQWESLFQRVLKGASYKSV